MLENISEKKLPVGMGSSGEQPAFPFTERYTAQQHCDSSLVLSYENLRKESENMEAFWGRLARETLTLRRDFTKVYEGPISNPKWFSDAELNVCENCVDIHARTHPDAIALMFEADDPSESRNITFSELLSNVCRVANMLKEYGVGRGTAVTTYMPMIPEHVYTVLACARLGALHSVVFSGYSAQSLASKLENISGRILVTATAGVRGGRTLKIKATCDEAMSIYGKVDKCFVFKHGGMECEMKEGRDIDASSEMLKASDICEAEAFPAEHPLFVLYTSGSTGQPKGLMHTSAGYLLYVKTTSRLSFDLRPGDRFGCVADLGWVTGHSYVVYGPLANGVATLVFESIPTYPNHFRYWDVIERHKLTQFYGAPTALRTIMKFDSLSCEILHSPQSTAESSPTEMASPNFRDKAQKFDVTSTLRVLGTVGEPINPNVWRWYFATMGRSSCAIVDTYWQTETGGHVIAPMPGMKDMKPGSACSPFFGLEAKIFDLQSGKEIVQPGQQGALCLTKPWPGMARTVYGNHKAFEETYFNSIPNAYFTGDAALIDDDGYIWILGRVDDTLNVSGHRMGSAEIENAANTCTGIAESAAVGVPDLIKGEAVCIFVVPKVDDIPHDVLQKNVKLHMRTVMGPICTPDYIFVVESVPKTRSGKIVRRLLRKIVTGAQPHELGDTSTVADPNVIPTLFKSITPIKVP